MAQTEDLTHDDRLLPSDCRPTMALLQRVFDNELSASVLVADRHASSCSVCRERIATAKLVVASLALVDGAATPNRELTEKIVQVLLAETTTTKDRFRKRVFALSGGLAIAASLFVAIWLAWPKSSQKTESADAGSTQPMQVDAPEKQPKQTARPVRLGDEFYKAEQALLGSSKPITEPAAVAPQVLGKLTDVLTRPAEPAQQFELIAISLGELPEAARSGLQPIAATTQKAFARLFRDVGAVQITAKPN